jgi:hypothetical protein
MKKLTPGERFNAIVNGRLSSPENIKAVAKALAGDTHSMNIAFHGVKESEGKKYDIVVVECGSSKASKNAVIAYAEAQTGLVGFDTSLNWTLEYFGGEVKTVHNTNPFHNSAGQWMWFLSVEKS